MVAQKEEEQVIHIAFKQECVCKITFSAVKCELVNSSELVQTF